MSAGSPPSRFANATVSYAPGVLDETRYFYHHGQSIIEQRVNGPSDSDVVASAPDRFGKVRCEEL